MQKRESTYELLRLVLMFLIIIHHSIVFGMGLTGLSWENSLPMYFSEWEKPIATLVNCLCICAVNCFVLISGYFSIKLNLKKITSLIITVLTYTFFFCSLYYLVIGNIKGAIANMLIFSHPTYWFINAYIYLSMIAPLINLMFKKMSHNFQISFVLFLLFVSCYLGFIWHNSLNLNGYNLFQFIFMYSIGGYLRYHPFKISKFKAILLYVCPSVLNGLIMYGLWQFGYLERTWFMTSYNNPLIILAAIGLFMFFSKLHLESKKINKLASSALAIYMVQSSPLCGEYYYKFINNLHYELGGGIWIIITLLALITMLLSIGIDQLQKPINKYLTNKLVCVIRKDQSHTIK